MLMGAISCCISTIDVGFTYLAYRTTLVSPSTSTLMPMVDRLALTNLWLRKCLKPFCITMWLFVLNFRRHPRHLVHRGIFLRTLALMLLEHPSTKQVPVVALTRGCSMWSLGASRTRNLVGLLKGSWFASFIWATPSS